MEIIFHENILWRKHFTAFGARMENHKIYIYSLNHIKL
jgi:hypothetical protein